MILSHNYFESEFSSVPWGLSLIGKQSPHDRLGRILHGCHPRYAGWCSSTTSASMTGSSPFLVSSGL
jgi:hypothetical protein